MKRPKKSIDYNLAISAGVTISLSLFLIFLAILSKHSPQTPGRLASPQVTLSNSPLTFPVPKSSTLSAVTFSVTGEDQVTPSLAAYPSGFKYRIPILTYHYIGLNPNPEDTKRFGLSVTPDNFETQMQYLKDNGYTPVDLDTLFQKFEGLEEPAKPIVLTFDDGYMDFYYNAYPILKKFNFKAVSFIPTNLMDQGYYLTWDQIKEMSGAGLVEFEDHSANHISLPAVSYDRDLEEFKISKQKLEAEIGKAVRFVCYPYGAVNNQVMRAAANAGFVGGVGTWFGFAYGKSLNMPRINVNGYTTLDTFAERLR